MYWVIVWMHQKSPIERSFPLPSVSLHIILVFTIPWKLLTVSCHFRCSTPSLYGLPIEQVHTILQYIFQFMQDRLIRKICVLSFDSKSLFWKIVKKNLLLIIVLRSNNNYIYVICLSPVLPKYKRISR